MPFDSIRDVGPQIDVMEPNTVSPPVVDRPTGFDSIRDVPTSPLRNGNDRPVDWDKVGAIDPVVDPMDLPEYVSPGMKLARMASRSLRAGESHAGEMIGATVASIAIPAAVTAVAGPGLGLASRMGMTALRAGSAGLGGMLGDRAQAVIDPTKETSWDHLKGVGIDQVGQQLLGETVVGPLASGAYKTAVGTGKAIGRRVTTAMGKPIPKYLQKAPSIVKVPSPEFSEAGKWIQEKGVSLLPSQASQDWWPVFKESMARSGIGSEQAFKLFEKEQQKKSIAAIDDVLQELGPLKTWTEGGQVGGDLYDMVKRTAGGSADAFGLAGSKLAQAEALYSPIYDAAEAASKDAMPTTAKLKEYTSRKLLENDAWLRDPKKGGGFLTPEGETLLNSVMNLQERVPTNFLRKLKSKWSSQYRKLSKDLDSSDKIAKDLAGIADESIFSSELNPNLPKEVKDQLRLANGMFRGHKEILERYFPVKVAEKFQEDPEYWFGQLFDKPGPHGGPLTAIKGIKEAITHQGLIPDIQDKAGDVIYKAAVDPEGILAWKKIQQASTWAVIHKATREDVINPKIIHDWVTDMGPEAAKELLGTEGMSVLRKAEAVGLLLAKKAQPHPWIVGSATIGAALSAARGLYNGIGGQDYVNFTIGGTLILGPRTLARVLMKPRTYATLEEIGRATPGTPKYGALAVRLVRGLQDDDSEAVKEQKAAVAENVRRQNQKKWTESQPTLEQYRSWKGGPRGL